MNWLKAIGYGIALFCIMFVIGSIVMFGLQLGGNKMGVIMLVAGIIVIYLLAQQFRINSLSDGLQVGLVWLIVDVLLENLVIVQIFNKGVSTGFYSWSVITGYVLIVAIPALMGQMKKA